MSDTFSENDYSLVFLLVKAIGQPITTVTWQSVTCQKKDQELLMADRNYPYD